MVGGRKRKWWKENRRKSTMRSCMWAATPLWAGLPEPVLPTGTPTIWCACQGDDSFLPSALICTPDKSLSRVGFVHKTSFHTTCRHTRQNTWETKNKFTIHPPLGRWVQQCPFPCSLCLGCGSEDEDDQPQTALTYSSQKRWRGLS